MTQGSWFDAFPMTPIFSKEQFESYRIAAEANRGFYESHLGEGARILNLGCGLGVSSIPLSRLGFRVVGVDNDPRVVEAAQQNANNFGGDCRIILGDVFDIVELFGHDSFDACDSGGLLEHFDREQVRSLVERQLLVAPLVLANMPVKTPATLRAYGVQDQDAEGNLDSDGIYRNFWDERTWVDDVLHGFHVVEHFVERAPPTIGEFDELTVVIDRSASR
jgi:SAM-dependent methyltransferase